MGPPQALLNSTGPLPAETALLARTTGQRNTDASSPSTCLKGGGAYSFPQSSASPPPSAVPSECPFPSAPTRRDLQLGEVQSSFAITCIPAAGPYPTPGHLGIGFPKHGHPCKCTRPQPFRQRSTVTHSSPPHHVGCTKGRLGEAVDGAVDRERM